MDINPKNIRLIGVQKEKINQNTKNKYSYKLIIIQIMNGILKTKCKSGRGEMIKKRLI